MKTEPAISLYQGQTVHERYQPFEHRFQYPILSILIDLDQLETAGRQSNLFSFEGFNLFSFYQKDHGSRDGSNLSSWARSTLQSGGVTDITRIRLLCFPRVLGYVFNPISIYFAENNDGELTGLIYQVHNTFGDDHAYVVATRGETVEHHDADKVFHVSPFFDVAGQYAFTLRPPEDKFQMSIRKIRENGPDLLATMSLKASSFTSGNIIKSFLRLPFSTLQAITGIHFQAVRLWLKGARYHPRPEPPGQPTFAAPRDSN